MNPSPFLPSSLTRRAFLRYSGSTVATVLAARSFGALSMDAIKLPPLSAKTEAQEKPESPSLPPGERVGFAVIGLGHIALERMLPAFAHSRQAKVTALVSGSREKARQVARQYGLTEKDVFGYDEFQRLQDHATTQAVYIALPNGLHAEYTAKSAKAGKHVLCEKPMAVSASECQQMIDACREARVKLMIGYRSQYEPLDRAIGQMIRAGKLGDLREFVASNSQNQGDPTQWRLNRKLAGGGPLPDVGIYCLNAARFLSGEEPTEVWGSVIRPTSDPRFKEVESTVQFSLRFPSGFSATASCGYDTHRSQFLRIQGTKGWAELDPAFAYDNLSLRYGQVVDGHDEVSLPSAKPADQFALEADHFVGCILGDREPLTGGPEGLQDQRIIEAIYRSAETGAVVQLTPPTRKVRGPDLPEA